MPLQIVEWLELLIVSCERLRVGLANGGKGAKLEDLSGKSDELWWRGGGRNQGILHEESSLGLAEEVVGGIQLFVLQSVMELRDEGAEVRHGVWCGMVLIFG